MARSIARVDTTSDELFDPAVTHVAGKSRWYEVERQDGRMIHHERMSDLENHSIFDQGISMDYVVGSGRRAKAYLYQEGRVLFMSPLNWYTQAGKWDLAPGYALDDPRRFDRRVTDECLSCHAGRVAALGHAQNLYEERPFHEMAIGCENCHGPGKKHVQLRSAGELPEGVSDPIVNPSRLDPDRRESVCNQCHLQAAVRLPRPGRSHLDFRPGKRLDDIWTILDIHRPIGADGKTHSVNHVQQMRESRCFTQSGGRLGCTSCHNPHQVPDEDKRVAFYRNRCQECHKDHPCSEAIDRRQQAQDDCSSCHMPARKSNNISHVTQTDHRVIRTQAPVSATESDESADTLVFFNNQNLRLTPLERDRALGLGAWIRLAKTGRTPPSQLGMFLNKILEQSPQDPLLLIALGTMAQEAGRLPLAQSYMERASTLPSSEEEARQSLMEIYYAQSDWEKALASADRLTEINPRHAKAFALRADILANLGRPADGISSARKAIELNPTLIPPRQWLVKVLRLLHREQEAQVEESILNRMTDSRQSRE
jgi:hypothetical protein